MTALRGWAAQCSVYAQAMKIYTKRGDQGETDLFGGERVSKDHLRVWAYGEIDELNAWLGVAIAHTDQADLVALLQDIQRSLFDLGAFLATPSEERRVKVGIEAPAAAVGKLEEHIDRFEDELPKMHHFVLPGGDAFAGMLHYARTVCRRAERRVIALAREEAIAPPVLQYLNRLSDFFFVLARVANKRAGVQEVPWSS